LDVGGDRTTSVKAARLFLSSYLCTIKWKNSPCSAGGHPLQELTHLLLDCPSSEPLRRAIFGTTSSIFDLWSRTWGVARVLGLHGVTPRPRPIPRKGSGSTTITTTKVYVAYECFISHDNTKVYVAYEYFKHTT